MGAPGSAATRVSWMVRRYLDPLLERSRGGGLPQVFCRDVGMWLQENVHDMAEDELSIVHGDFRFGNFIWQGTKLAGVVDWDAPCSATRCPIWGSSACPSRAACDRS